MGHYSNTGGYQDCTPDYAYRESKLRRRRLTREENMCNKEAMKGLEDHELGRDDVKALS